MCDPQTVSYDIVARSGDRFKSGIVGQMLDKDGKPVYATNSDGTKNMEAAEVSDNPDFIGKSRLINVDQRMLYHAPAKNHSLLLSITLNHATHTNSN